MALPDDILRKVADLERRIAAMERNPQPPNIAVSELVAASFDLDSGGNVLISVRLWNDGGARLLSSPPPFSIFKNSVTTDDLFPSGSNWSNDERAGIALSSWVDWGTSDDFDVRLKVFLVNFTATNYTGLQFRGNFRFLQKEAAV